MKSIIKAYPYPILGRGDDYIDSTFQCSMNLEIERKNDSEFVSLTYEFFLDCLEIEELIKNKIATFAIDVRCTDTLYRKVYYLEKNGSIEFDVGQLYGKAQFSPFIITNLYIQNYQSKNLNDEFGLNDFTFRVGDTVAISEPEFRYIEFNKLQFESLVTVETSDEIPDETYRFNLEQDMIIILMGKKFRRLWDYCREDKDKAPMLAMSVYKDCIHAAIEYITKNDEAETYKWARALNLKLSALEMNIKEDLDFNELCTLSQQLVAKYGVQKVLKNVE